MAEEYIHKVGHKGVIKEVRYTKQAQMNNLSASYYMLLCL